MNSILVMGRNELTAEEWSLLRETFPRVEFEVLVDSTTDAESHLHLCQKKRPVLVFLPRQPVVRLAMVQGFAHVAVFDGQLKELVAVKPEFKPFVAPKIPVRDAY